jgi:hypothetical protein
MPNDKSKIKILEEAGLETNEHYKKYKEQKDKIKARYPSELFKHAEVGRTNPRHTDDYIKNYHSLYKEYLKEIAQLMLTPNSHFQEFIWDILPEYEIKKRESKTRGRKNRSNFAL